MKNAFLGLLLVCGSVSAGEFKAGVGRVNITPQSPMWLSGYASRNHPSDGVVQDLWARALALESEGQRVVIVTTDLIGLPREVSDEVVARAARKHKLQRSQLLLNSAHTHSAPAVWPNLEIMFNISPEDQKVARQYSRKLMRDLESAIDEAIADLAPAQVSVGHGEVGFTMNRRQPTPAGVRLGVNPPGPSDRDVPVVKIAGPDGKLRAVLFGYACHNTTLGGDFYKINGDYAGFAEADLEKSHPGTTAMFMILCGADQNPNPRGTLELAQQHGKTLAQEVDRVLGGELRPVRPPVRTACESIRLDFAPHERKTFEAEAKSTDKYRQKRAQAMLKAYDAGHPVRQVAYPVQAVRLGDDLTFVALGGEVVVDYALRAKREFPKENLIVAGYSNEVMCYIPSRRVLKEGGYEVVDSMIYYGMPGPLAENVEDTVFAAIRRVLQATGAKVAP
ncbi:MAG: neutral/alkaline non-lysosomal ceramidase N-terminal domain-containing protein [Pirellulales bacterium]